METRLEVRVNGSWRELVLFSTNTIKYNKVINKIGSVDDRSISHTNTFSLPRVQKNIFNLGLNIFNLETLAEALNTKYEARYFVNDQLVQEGFLVINNTTREVINVNFIDSSLSLVELWGSTTFKQLLTDTELSIPDDYLLAIQEMQTYQMPVNDLLEPLSEVGTRGYNLALFPNNLNTIGDKFQLDQNGDRLNDTFNPYQSRPIFNVKALFDLAVEAYGYTPIYDASVDWDRVQKTFMVSSGLGENVRDASLDFITLNHGNFPTQTDFDTFVDPPGGFRIEGPAQFNQNIAVAPSSIPEWDPFLDPFAGPFSGYENLNVIFKPFIENGFDGTLTFTTTVPPPATALANLVVSGVWYDTGQTTTVYKSLPSISSSYASVVIDKQEILNPPAGAGDFIGLCVRVEFGYYFDGVARNFFVSTLETYVPPGIIAYDEFGQFIGTGIDLTYAAPNVTIKKLLGGIMQKEGMLLNIDAKNQTVEFFTYGAYLDRRDNEEYTDLSQYFQLPEGVEYNTNFGNFYGILNRIGLTDPYPGNTFDILFNDIELNKYKEFSENYVALFKDVSNVVNVEFSTTPYLEFTNLGLGLVEQVTPLGQLTQVRADGTSQGTFTDLAALENVNYLIIPDGVKEWYNLIKDSVIAKGFFLLPERVFNELDISKPVFISRLNGFYIIEEVAEYENGFDLVVISLIKLIDNIRD